MRPNSAAETVFATGAAIVFATVAAKLVCACPLTAFVGPGRASTGALATAGPLDTRKSRSSAAKAESTSARLTPAFAKASRTNLGLRLNKERGSPSRKAPTGFAAANAWSRQGAPTGSAAATAWGGEKFFMRWGLVGGGWDVSLRGFRNGFRAAHGCRRRGGGGARRACAP